VKISGRRTYLAGLESVAMTDIVLNMFIFFFISFSLLYTFSPRQVQKLDLKLPQARQTSSLSTSERIAITFTEEGWLYLDQKKVSLKELKSAVKEKYAQNPDLVAVLYGERMANYEEAVRILDLLTELGVSRVSIAAVKER
jgi:biopolymer transport protein ExbD